MSFCRVFLLGHLGRDPEIKPVGEKATPMCKFSIATTDGFGDKKETTWHNVVAWGKLAENCAKYLAKGREAWVEGRLVKRSWEKDGEKREAIEVVASDVRFIGGSGKKPEPKPAPTEVDPELTADDIPF